MCALKGNQGRQSYANQTNNISIDLGSQWNKHEALTPAQPPHKSLEFNQMETKRKMMKRNTFFCHWMFNDPKRGRLTISRYAFVFPFLMRIGLGLVQDAFRLIIVLPKHFMFSFEFRKSDDKITIFMLFISLSCSALAAWKSNVVEGRSECHRTWTRSNKVLNNPCSVLTL